MSEKGSPTLEDRLAERLARLGLIASVSTLIILAIIVVGNVLVRLLQVAANLVLSLVIYQGPIAATIIGGFSTFTTYYGWSRIVRRREKLNVREEAKGQAMDQAGNVLQNLSGEIPASFGCATRLAPVTLGLALIACFFTYIPSLMPVFGANIPVTGQTQSTSAAVVSPSAGAGQSTSSPSRPSGTKPTATAIPGATATSAPATATPTPAPGATATPVPTATPAPGSLRLQSSTTIAFGNYCGDSFTGQHIAFANVGGAPLFWSVSAPAFHLQPPASGELPPGSSHTGAMAGATANSAIVIAWGSAASNEPHRVTITTTCNPPPPGNLDVLTPSIRLSSDCMTDFSGDSFAFTNNGGTPIFWTVEMPSGFALEPNVPATGQLQPFQGDTQTEFFQGLSANATIDIAWGYSVSNEPFVGTVSAFCMPIP